MTGQRRTCSCLLAIDGFAPTNTPAQARWVLILIVRGVNIRYRTQSVSRCFGILVYDGDEPKNWRSSSGTMSLYFRRASPGLRFRARVVVVPDLRFLVSFWTWLMAECGLNSSSESESTVHHCQSLVCVCSSPRQTWCGYRFELACNTTV